MITHKILEKSRLVLVQCFSWTAVLNTIAFAQAAPSSIVWADVTLADKTSFPCRLSKRDARILDGSSMVYAVEQSRVTRQETKAGRNGAGCSTVLDIHYHIKQVLVGDRSLKGRHAVATACSGLSKDYSNDPTLIDWLPHEGSQIVSLAKIEAERVRVYSTVVTRFSLPFECKGGEDADRSPEHSCLARVIADFRGIDDTSNYSSRPTRISTEKLRKKTDLYQVWVLWNLGGNSADDNIKALMEYCKRESHDPLLQCLADSKIMRSSHAREWRYCEDRQAMYGRWINLESDQLADVTFRYLNHVALDWNRAGYGKEHFVGQITRRLNDGALSVAVRWRLERLLQTIDRP